MGTAQSNPAERWCRQALSHIKRQVRFAQSWGFPFFFKKFHIFNYSAKKKSTKSE
jgi:hypothetical protein